MTDVARCADRSRDALATALYAAAELAHAVEFQRAEIERARNHPRGDKEAITLLCANLPRWEGASRDADVAVDEAISKILGQYRLAPDCLATVREQLRADPYIGLPAASAE